MNTAATSIGQSRMVTALFNDRNSAERAYLAAKKLGYEESEVTLVMSGETRRRYFPDEGQANTELSHRANEDTGTSAANSKLGGPLGGTLGTLAPAAAAGTLLFIPGIIFASPIAIALAAAGAVGLAGGLAGALTNWGLPSKRVEEYEADIRKDGILMGVKTNTLEDAISLEQQWKAIGGRLVHS